MCVFQIEEVVDDLAWGRCIAPILNAPNEQHRIALRPLGVAGSKLVQELFEVGDRWAIRVLPGAGGVLEFTARTRDDDNEGPVPDPEAAFASPWDPRLLRADDDPFEVAKALRLRRVVEVPTPPRTPALEAALGVSEGSMGDTDPFAYIVAYMRGLLRSSSVALRVIGAEGAWLKPVPWSAGWDHTSVSVEDVAAIERLLKDSELQSCRADASWTAKCRWRFGFPGNQVAVTQLIRLHDQLRRSERSEVRAHVERLLLDAFLTGNAGGHLRSERMGDHLYSIARVFEGRACGIDGAVFPRAQDIVSGAGPVMAQARACVQNLRRLAAAGRPQTSGAQGVGVR